MIEQDQTGIDEFEAIEHARLNDWEQEFRDSVVDQWAEREYLSEAQWEIIEKICRRNRK